MPEIVVGDPNAPQLLLVTDAPGMLTHPVPSQYWISNARSPKDVNVSIIFGVSHHGGSGGWNGSKFFPICPATSNSITLNCG